MEFETHFVRIIAMPVVDGVWKLGRGIQILVVREFWDPFMTLPSLTGAEVLEAVRTAATTFVVMTFVEVS